jgi:hypothetical protein
LTSWLIIRTDHAKEAYVARQIMFRGWDAWVPAQIIVCRPSIARRVSAKSHLQKTKELPILPRRVFAAVPMWAVHQAELDGLRHMVAFEQNADQSLVQINPAEIARFRAAIDAENTAALALAQKASRKQKAKWRSLHDALLDMIDAAKQQIEAAA